MMLLTSSVLLPPAPPANKLLAALPGKVRQHFMDSCENVELVLADVLSKPGDIIGYVYFPTDSVISSAMPLKDGVGLKIRLIGNEGMLGVPLMLGVNVTQLHAVVQRAGPALRIKAALFLREIDQSTKLQRRLRCYIHVLMNQLGQTIACNRFHMVEQRLARLLLMLKDRSYSNELCITQDVLSHLLSVRRVGVSNAAGSLQRKNLISYIRGEIKIHDIAGLERASCECYQADKDTYNRVLHEGLAVTA